MELLKSFYYNLKSALSFLGIFGQILVILITIIFLPIIAIVILSVKILKFFKLFFLELYHYSRKTYKASKKILSVFIFYRKRIVRFSENLIEKFLIEGTFFTKSEIKPKRYSLAKESWNLFLATLGNLVTLVSLIASVVTVLIGILWFLKVLSLIPKDTLYLEQISFMYNISLKIVLGVIIFSLVLLRQKRLKKKYNSQIQFNLNYSSKFWKNEYNQKTEAINNKGNEKSYKPLSNINLSENKKTESKIDLETKKASTKKLSDKKSSITKKTEYIKISGPKVLGKIKLQDFENKWNETDYDNI